jgi:hypothetical protein
MGSFLAAISKIFCQFLKIRVTVVKQSCLVECGDWLWLGASNRHSLSWSASVYKHYPAIAA